MSARLLPSLNQCGTVFIFIWSLSSSSRKWILLMRNYYPIPDGPSSIKAAAMVHNQLAAAWLRPRPRPRPLRRCTDAFIKLALPNPTSSAYWQDEEEEKKRWQETSQNSRESQMKVRLMQRRTVLYCMPYV